MRDRQTDGHDETKRRFMLFMGKRLKIAKALVNFIVENFQRKIYHGKENQEELMELSG